MLTPSWTLAIHKLSFNTNLLANSGDWSHEGGCRRRHGCGEAEYDRWVTDLGVTHLFTQSSVGARPETHELERWGWGPSPHAHWRRENNKQKWQKDVTLAWQQRVWNRFSPKDLTFSFWSGATTRRHVQVIIFQMMKIQSYTCQALAASDRLSRNIFALWCFVFFFQFEPRLWFHPGKVASDFS